MTTFRKLAFPSLILLSIALISGCALFGKNAGPPTAIERQLFTIETNYTTKVITLTNVVPLFQTNVQVLNVTNIDHQVVQFTNFQTVVNYQTNVATSTNVVPTYTESPGTGSNTIQTIGGAVAAPFG